jgi:hypothetical protein
MNEEPSPSWNVEDASFLEDEVQADKSLGSRIKVGSTKQFFKKKKQKKKKKKRRRRRRRKDADLLP